RGGPAWSGLGGLMLGAVPMSKLQAAPLALAAGLYWVWAEWRASGPASRRPLVYLIAGAVLPSVFFILPVVIAGQWDHFVTSFITDNLSYTASGETSLANLLGDLLRKSFEEDSLLHLWLPGTIVWCALAFRARAIPDRTARTFTLLALAATVIGMGCVLRAGRPFLHYWQLVVLPVTFLLGALLGNLAGAPAGATKTDRWIVAACALGLLVSLGSQRWRKGSLYLGSTAYFATHPRNSVSDHVLAQARSGDTIAIWGWANYVYVETGLRQATRDAHSERSIKPGPLQVYFRERFLVDLMVTRPAIFLDAIGPCSLFFRAPELKHERNYPGLGEFIRTQYQLVDEIDGARIYRRRDPTR
ncbi:MAG TPA: hypothetical protein VFJ90_04745, partial [Candidatus Didemnitutus sp.]|nr:hypothetical protein [Candidatus Didemnitutus sp.]